MFHIQVIKCQGTEGSNGPQQPRPGSLGLPHPCSMAQGSVQAQPRAVRGAVGVWLSSHTTAEPTLSLSSPFPQRHLGMPQLPSWPALLPGQAPGMWPGWWGSEGSLMSPGTWLQAAASTRSTVQWMCVITNLGRVCVPLSSTGGKFSKQRSQTTHLQQCG